MVRVIRLTAFVAALFAAQAALASETITFKYDARGRLVKVQRGPAGANLKSEYCFDRAGNRVKRRVATSGAPNLACVN